MKNMAHNKGIRSSLRMSMANTAIMPPMASEYGIAHEHLCRKSIIPQEADKSTDEGGHIYHKLFTARDIHDVEISGVDHVAAKVGHDSERHADDGRHSRAQSVESVGEVGAVGCCGDDEDHYDHKQDPSGGGGVLSVPRCEVGIVEIVVLTNGMVVCAALMFSFW